jgi:hypothetical protein
MSYNPGARPAHALGALPRRVRCHGGGSDQRGRDAAWAAEHPDAELIRVCADHAIRMDAFTAYEGDEEGDEYDALFDAYMEAYDRVGALRARTVEGAQAKAGRS